MTDKEYMAIGRATMRAAAELPEGWRLTIELRRDTHEVYFADPGGSEIHLDLSHLPINIQINASIDRAIADAVEREDDDD